MRTVSGSHGAELRLGYGCSPLYYPFLNGLVWRVQGAPKQSKGRKRPLRVSPEWAHECGSNEGMRVARFSLH